MLTRPHLSQLTIRAAVVASVLVATAACGSQLTEQQVVARSATQVTGAAAQGGSSTPGGAAVDAGGGPSIGGTAATLPAAASGGSAGGGSSGLAAAPGAGPGTAAATAPCTTKETGPIIVGNVGNYSGPGGAAVGQLPRGVQLWAAMINSQGGLCGRQVQVVVQDDGGDPARYGSLVRDLVENRHVVSFVGNGAPLSAQGGLDYHRQSGVPVIGDDCTTGFWFDSPVLFPQCPTPTVVLTGLVANGVAVTGKNKFGYVYCTEAQGCLDADRILAGGAVKDGGGQLAFRKSVSLTQVDFTAECQTARDSGVQLFFVGADPATLERVAQSCGRQNFYPQYVSASVTWSANSLSTRGLENVVLTTATAPFTGGSGAVDQYHRAIQSFAPGTKPGPGLALGWIAGKLFELAATRAAQAGHTITAQTLISALYAFHDETLGGLTTGLNFAPTGARNRSCYFTMKGDGTGNGYQLPNGVNSTCR
jgi:branched-chain amino acid transport system substrate-binding protein